MDVLTKKQRSYNMSQIKAKNTNPEIYIKNILRRNNVKGFSLHGSLLGKPDIIFRKKKIALFMDGCFWHKCPECFIEPRTRRKFWLKKITQNVIRDKKINKELKKRGWKVIRIWEHEIKAEGYPIKIARIIKALLKSLRAS